MSVRTSSKRNVEYTCKILINLERTVLPCTLRDNISPEQIHKTELVKTIERILHHDCESHGRDIVRAVSWESIIIGKMCDDIYYREMQYLLQIAEAHNNELTHT